MPRGFRQVDGGAGPERAAGTVGQDGEVGHARTGWRAIARLGVFVVAPLVAVATGWLVYDQGLDRAANWLEVLSFPFAVVAGYLTYLVWPGRGGGGRGAQAHDLDAVAAELADAVRAQWRAEERMLRLQDPVPIPVRWEQTDHLADDRRERGVRGRQRLGGTVDRIADGYRQLPRGRMVALGEGGAGKSVLCVRLVLGLLEEPGQEVRVPVLVRLASWDPEKQRPWDYAAEQLAADYPWLAVPTVSGPPVVQVGRRRRRRTARPDTLARALVRTGRLLPVFDGLDEMPEGVRPRALRALNAELDRDDMLVLTSRPDEYEQAVREGHQLVGAVVMRLLPLGPADLADFLPRTTRAVPQHERDKWASVLEEVRGRPNGRLARVLSTPLMASLARNIYSDTDADPAELLDTDRFPDRRALADHLLGEFLPAVYDGPPGIRDESGQEAAARPPWGQWSSDQARRWLTALASSASEQKGDLAWWRLGGRATGVLLGFLIATSFVGTVLLSRSLAFPGTVAIGPVETGLAAWQSLAMFGTVPAVFLTLMVSRHTPSPSSPGRFPAGDLVVGLVWFSLLGSMAIVAPLLEDRLLELVVTVVIAGVWAPVALYVQLVGPAASTPARIGARNPAAALRDDRVAALTLLTYSRGGAAGVAMIALITLQPLAMLVFWSTRSDVAVAAWAGAIGTSVVLFCGTTALLSAWGRFGVVRALLAVTDRAPWRLLAFLADAHRRGVLRQYGAVYRFRHADLADYLLRRLGAVDERTADRTGPAPPARESGSKPVAWHVRLSRGLVVVGPSALSLSLCILGHFSVVEKLPSSPGPYRSVAPPCELLFENEEALAAARAAGRVRLVTKTSCMRVERGWNGVVSLEVDGPHPAGRSGAGLVDADFDFSLERAMAGDRVRSIDLGEKAFITPVRDGEVRLSVQQHNLVLSLWVSTTASQDEDLVRRYTRLLARQILERVDESVQYVDPPWPITVAGT